MSHSHQLTDCLAWDCSIFTATTQTVPSVDITYNCIQVTYFTWKYSVLSFLKNTSIQMLKIYWATDYQYNMSIIWLEFRQFSSYWLILRLVPSIKTPLTESITMTYQWAQWHLKSPVSRFLLNRLFRHIWKKTSKLHVTGLCVGNSPVTGEFPPQRASNAENVSIRWHHHAT